MAGCIQVRLGCAAQTKLSRFNFFFFPFLSQKHNSLCPRSSFIHKLQTPPHFQDSHSLPPATSHHHSTAPPPATAQRWRRSSPSDTLLQSQQQQCSPVPTARGNSKENTQQRCWRPTWLPSPPVFGGGSRQLPSPASLMTVSTYLCQEFFFFFFLFCIVDNCFLLELFLEIA